MFTNNAQIRCEIYKRYCFEECFLLAIRWRHNGATADLVFHYLWADDNGYYLTQNGTAGRKEGRLVLDSQETRIVSLYGVEELRLRNSLGPDLRSQPESAGAGLREVAVFDLENNDLLLGQYSRRPELHHVSALSDASWRLDVVFHGLSVSQGPTASTVTAG